jgi:hypothetical protein
LAIVRRAAASNSSTAALSGQVITASIGTIGAPASSLLATAAAALSPGQSANFAAGLQSNFTDDDLAWQTAFYHDDLHGLIHLMGKRQNADSSWGHQIYPVTSSTWGQHSSGMWRNVGHIYGNTAMDFTTGDVFQTRSALNGDAPGPLNPKKASWWKHAEQAWSFMPVDITAGGLEDIANGVAWHPHLFGTNDGGLCWNDQSLVFVWRKSNNQVYSIGHDYSGDKEGVGCYWEAQNCVLIGGSAGSGAELIRIDPNGSGTPICTSMGEPPINVGGHSHLSGAGFGSLHVHPGNPNKVQIMETASNNVYESTDGENWTQVGDHPFTQEPRVICSLRGNLGCYWSIGADFSRLWRPPV